MEKTIYGVYYNYILMSLLHECRIRPVCHSEGVFRSVTPSTGSGQALSETKDLEVSQDRLRE